MKLMLLFPFLLVAILAKADVVPSEVTLVSRYNEGNYNTATFSFRHMTQDISVTGNNYEILFEARQDFEDYFRVNMVVDDFSFIADLGEQSCKEIQSSYPEARSRSSLAWLGYTNIDTLTFNGYKHTALVKTNHCYLAFNNDGDGRVVTLFHVKSHVKSKSVVIDEIEVLDLLTRNASATVQ